MYYFCSLPPGSSVHHFTGRPLLGWLALQRLSRCPHSLATVPHGPVIMSLHCVFLIVWSVHPRGFVMRSRQSKLFSPLLSGCFIRSVLSLFPHGFIVVSPQLGHCVTRAQSSYSHGSVSFCLQCSRCVPAIQLLSPTVQFLCSHDSIFSYPEFDPYLLPGWSSLPLCAPTARFFCSHGSVIVSIGSSFSGRTICMSFLFGPSHCVKIGFGTVLKRLFGLRWPSLASDCLLVFFSSGLPIVFSTGWASFPSGHLG